MMKGWTGIAYLSAARAKRLGQESLGSLIRESFVAKFGDEGLEAWAKLPLAVRVETSTTSSGRRKHPTRTVDLAPPGNGIAACGGKGSYLLLDLTNRPARLTLILFDWDNLALDRHSLDVLGIDSAKLASLLRRKQQPDDSQRSRRWIIRESAEVVELVSGDLGREDVSPIVGRLWLGAFGVDKDDLRAEVLAPPRLVNNRSRSREIVALDGNSGAAARFLSGTVWRRGAPNLLLALLRLAHAAPLAIGGRRVELSTTENASPLAWLALVDALEKAADHQRRQYTRVNQTVRAPTGTLRFNAYIGNLARQRPERVPVSRHVLSRDTLENQLFKGMACRLRQSLRDSGPLADWLRGRLETVEAAFHHSTDIAPAPWMCDRLLSKPMPDVLVQAVERCQDALRGRYPGLTLDPGSRAEVSEFEIDIAELFEAAMRRVLSQASGATVIDGNTTRLLHTLSWSGTNTGSIHLKPDFAVVHGSRADLVGDAKYKRTFEQTSFRPLLRSDFQQLCTYLLAWPDARRGVVLMPAVEESPSESATELVATLDTGTGQKLAVFRVDVAKWNHRTLGGEPLARWLAAR